jgi:lantibiotic modifying enzyme
MPVPPGLAGHPAGESGWPCGPFLAVAADRISRGAGQRLTAGHADAGQVGDRLAAALARPLARIVARVMTTAAPGDPLVPLFAEYPVLARLLGSATQLAVEAGLELLDRFAADRDAIVATLLDGTDPGPLTGLEPGLGDPHRGGRSVTLVSFADGRQVIYKPRSVAAQLWFGTVLDWLSQRVPGSGLALPRAVARPGHGWLEFVAPAPLAQPSDAARFYRRTGVLLAALYATGATDIHGGNLIARGDQPVVIDAETLFHPTLPAPRTTAPDPAAHALAASVHRTALLPSPVPAPAGLLDQSGLGGAGLAGRERGRNRPWAGGVTAEPADYTGAVLAGFRCGYDAIASDRAAFSELLESGRDLEVRVVARPSSGYAWLLDEATEPGLLRDAPARERALAALHEVSAPDQFWRRLADAELADLATGDIPLLTTRPGGRDVWSSAGRHFPGLLARPGLSCALDTVARLSQLDRRDQEWVISASLATRELTAGHHDAPRLAGPVTAVEAGPQRLLAAACGLADQIVAQGRTSPDPGRVNWLGLQAIDDARWLLLPMGASLADGYLGVALFLAQLGALTGVSRYAAEARRAVSPLPQLCEVLAGRDDLIAAVGCGGLTGLGGIAYGLGRLAVLLDDPGLRHWAAAAVDLAGRAAATDERPGWSAGQAGCLAAMSAVRADLGLAAAGRVAQDCAGRLAAGARLGRPAPDPAGLNQLEPDEVPGVAGFASGLAGIGWALSRYAAAYPGSGYGPAGQRAVERALALAGPATLTGAAGRSGWCTGQAGLLLARHCLPDAGPAGLAAAAQALAARPLLADLSLCHGELGAAEALISMDGLAPGESPHRARRHRAGEILDAVSRGVAGCGAPRGVPTPGLLNGLAGIGYGLLRLGFADQVPAVLLLEPGSQTR